MAVVQIAAELLFFGFLVLCSEVARLLARRCGAEGLAQGLLVSSLVCGWYSVSITLTLYNKWLVSSWQEGGLKYPIFYTMTHMVMKGCFSASYLVFVRRRQLPKTRKKLLLGTALVGVCTGLDVAASNLAFLYISVTFFTMLKSASLIFILIMGAITCVEPCSVGVVGTVSIICGGIFLASYGEAEFNMTGFWLVLVSEVFAALRWVTTQMVLQGGKLDSMTAVFYMSPSSSMALVPLVLSLEAQKVDCLERPESAIQYLLMVLFPGFLAFILLLVEVQLVKETSSLTLSVFGNLKSIVTILFAIIVFGETAEPIQWLGLLIALAGMLAYSHVKKKRMSVDAFAVLGYETLPDEEDDDDDLDSEAGGGVGIELTSPTAGAGKAASGGGGQAEAPVTVLGKALEQVARPSPEPSPASGAESASDSIWRHDEVEDAGIFVVGEDELEQVDEEEEKEGEMAVADAAVPDEVPGEEADNHEHAGEQGSEEEEDEEEEDEEEEDEEEHAPAAATGQPAQNGLEGGVGAEERDAV